MKNNNINIIKNCFKYIKPYRKKFSLLIMINIVTILFSVVQPIIFGNIIDCISQSDIFKLNSSIELVIILFIFSVIFGFVQAYFTSKCTLDIELDFKGKIF